MSDWLYCHAADGPPPQVVPRTIYGNFVAVDGPPGPSVAAATCPPVFSSTRGPFQAFHTEWKATRGNLDMT